MAIRAADHVRSWGASTSVVGAGITAENQTPDRLGAHHFQFGEESLSPSSLLEKRLHEMDDASRRLETLHRARVALERSSARDRLYHQVLGRTHTVYGVAQRALSRSRQDPTTGFAIRQATQAADSVLEQLRGLLKSPTGQ